ncbi:MAG TPA: AMP-binding protein, partial [Rhodothermales bacterium]
RVYNTIKRTVEEGTSLKRRIFDWAVATGKAAVAARKNGSVGPMLAVQQKLAHQLVFAKLHERLGGNLRFAVSGGAALPREVGEFFEAAGIMIIEGYGLTETAPVLSVNPWGLPRYGTVGHVIPGVTVAIQSLEDGRILGQLSGEDYPSTLSTAEGEILAKGPNVMKGYWNRDEATREAIDAQGWYHTGDVGRFDDGYLTITDRIKHMIVSAGGKNIYPGPIEERFKSLTMIDQIVVIGERRDYLTALVVPNLDVLKQYAGDRGIAVESDEQLLSHPDIQKRFDDEFRAYSRGAAAHEKIRAFRLLSEPFTVENGLLTPTMKPRRRQIEERYAELIEAMYRA